jgi:hypothetical protein
MLYNVSRPPIEHNDFTLKLGNEHMSQAVSLWLFRDYETFNHGKAPPDAKTINGKHVIQAKEMNAKSGVKLPRIRVMDQIYW